MNFSIPSPFNQPLAPHNPVLGEPPGTAPCYLQNECSPCVVWQFPEKMAVVSIASCIFSVFSTILFYKISQREYHHKIIKHFDHIKTRFSNRISNRPRYSSCPSITRTSARGNLFDKIEEAPEIV